jgi:hypothetical protein
MSAGSRIAGYAAVFDHPDRGGDVVRRGAFSRAARAGQPLLRQHDPRRRIGTVESLAEDDRGLRVIAVLDAGQAVTAGDGLSFGYRVRRSVNGTYRELIEVDLIEVSLVDHPMQPRARVIAVEPGPARPGEPVNPQGEEDGL